MRKSIFHEDWWLDALAPGRWREVTCLRGGGIAGVLRFVERSEGGMKICEMPQITRVLGPVITPQSGKAEARTRSTHSIITELLQQIAEHNHVEMILDTGFSDLAPFLHAGYDVKVHPTLLLDCNRPVKDLWAGLRDKVRNVVRRAREQPHRFRDIDDVEGFVNFLLERTSTVKICASIWRRYPLLLPSARSREQCKIVAAIDEKWRASRHGGIYLG